MLNTRTSTYQSQINFFVKPLQNQESPSKKCANAYTYGFNGKEKDSGEFGNTTYDYGARMYNPSIGRWFKPDPHAHRYVSFSPYSFVNNSPIQALELDGRDWILLVWSPEAGLNQGHAAIAISNYKKNAEGKMVSDGTYIIYEASEIGSNDVSKWINNPSMTVPGKVITVKAKSKEELLNQVRNMGFSDRVDGVVEFNSTYSQDKLAKEELNTYVTKYTIIPSKNPFDMEGEQRKPVNPIEYSLTTDNPDAFNCSGFVAKMAKKLYDVDLGAPENINFNGGKIFTGTKSIGIPSMSINSYTPGSVFRGGVRSGGRVLKGAKYSYFFKSFEGYGNLDLPFVNAVTGGQLKDTNPKK